MKFEEALVELKKGNASLRTEWNDGSILDIYGGGIVRIIHPNEKYNYYTLIPLRFDDIEANDWFLYEEPGKTFDQVFEAFKKGKSIRRKEWLEYDETKNMHFQISEVYTKLNSQDLLETDWEVIE